MKFDMKTFIASCQEALKQPEPAQVVRQLVQDAIAEPDALREAFAETSKAKSLRDAAIFRSENLSFTVNG